jgi:hypothetical protein
MDVSTCDAILRPLPLTRTACRWDAAFVQGRGEVVQNGKPRHVKLVLLDNAWCCGVVGVVTNRFETGISTRAPPVAAFIRLASSKSCDGMSAMPPAPGILLHRGK